MLSIKPVAKSACSILLRDSQFCTYSSLLQAPAPNNSATLKLSAEEMVAPFKSWFKAQNSPLLDQFFTILTAKKSIAARCLNLIDYIKHISF
ncbi:hypothetical protein SLEP1_g37934 [Rubroshorea leprosula]|uniref:Uncharacterized protein n=1 Tax=Rubroshorea leprosula TaxID=152421 RepID=A0AAV5KWH6_9ROSI|nr:hypothetical protein SLEP1_g37934 [Rubroshorea leprosula]